MFFKQLATKEASLSYFFGCAGQGKAVAIDVVAGDEDWFIAEAERAQVRITHVIDTHVHADHYSGGRELARRVGAPYCLHESDRGRVQFAFTLLIDDQVIEVGNVQIRVLHTPGHTPDSLCLLVADLRRGTVRQAVPTLGFEKRWNPALALDKAAFVDALTGDIPPRPADMDARVRANLGLVA